MASIDGTVEEKGLAKGTNWWGAFVIGLAGTILVTGIAPYVVQGTGALGIILMGVMTIAGCFRCFCLAELATMWPDRTGGIPSYASESFRPLVGNAAARHFGGVSGWAYWLGWFPVVVQLPGGIGFFDTLYRLFLPSVPIALGLFGYLSRMTRAGTIDVLVSDYVRTAVLKGIARPRVIVRHVLPNALLPTIAVIGTQFGALIGNLVVIEVLFNYPGIGDRKSVV